MVSGSQLQVAKLAQMCPVVPNGGLRWPALACAGLCRPAAQVKTRMEHLGAPWSTKCPFKTNLPSFYVRLKKKEGYDSLSSASSDWNLEAPKEPLGA